MSNRSSAPATSRTASNGAAPREAASNEAAPSEAIGDISLAINEIFVSIQGESTWAGQPCVFVRTTGCPLRCRWCDTEYAFYEGRRWRLADLVEEACRPGLPLVEITGGEPLVQPGVPALAAALLERQKTVLVETSGAYDISVLPEGAICIMDLKCPSSGECERNDLGNLERLRPHDEVKFVIGTRQDYEWAVARVREHRLERWPVIFSPVWDELSPEVLAGWILADRLPVRMQLQLHKLIWPGVERGV